MFGCLIFDVRCLMFDVVYGWIVRVWRNRVDSRGQRVSYVCCTPWGAVFMGGDSLNMSGRVL